MTIKEALNTGLNPYMFLGRLETDCKYFLDGGNGESKYLWTGSVEAQVTAMLYIYCRCLTVKPLWINKKKIRRYYQRMKSMSA